MNRTYWQILWLQFRRHALGMAALILVLAFCFVGVYAPFLASGKPLFVLYDGVPYFPLFRYLFYSGFYTKRLDIFFNLMMFTLPALLLSLKLLNDRTRYVAALTIVFIQFAAFSYFAFTTPQDPASNPALNQQRHEALQQLRKEGQYPDWNFELAYMTPYAKLNLILRTQLRKEQQLAYEHYRQKFTAAAHQRWLTNAIRERKRALTQNRQSPARNAPSDEEIKNELLKADQESFSASLPTLWEQDQEREKSEIAQLNTTLAHLDSTSADYLKTQSRLKFIQDRRQWLETQSALLRFKIMPLLSHFHWEDDAGGQQNLNQYLHWWELTRINHKDLLAALIFGVRISLVVGVTAVALALLIGIPIGALAGFYGGRTDILVSRLLEIWEAMPTFFMLLMVVAILQSKSIFLVIAVIGLFGWTGYSRYIRGEFFKQRSLPYVEACQALGFRNGYIMFKHILPNAIPPVLTLLPFAIMGAITSEAGLSFLGLGEEGSCSWGVLMDEGRTAFPQESYLLWPPAILLTTLLIAIAIVGDTLRDSIDPKQHRQ